MSGAATIMLLTFRDSLVFFYAPTELKSKAVPPGKFVRIGGLVEKESLRIDPKTLEVHFRVTDLATSLEVQYQGLLPDLFREEQGVVAEGHLTNGGSFKATTLFAKHDENYMPPEVAESLKTYQKP